MTINGRQDHIIMSICLAASGRNEDHQLGFESDGLVPSLVPVELNDIICIAAGADHSVFIYEDGHVMALGDDREYQIGTDKRVIYTQPAPVSFEGEYITWAHCGEMYTAYLSVDGIIFLCSSKYPDERKKIELEDEPFIYICGNFKDIGAIDQKGRIHIYDEDLEEAPQVFTLPKPSYDMALGNNFTLAITVDGEVYGFGVINDNRPTFTIIPSLKGISCSRVFAYSAHAAVLTKDGKVYTYGDGTSGQLGSGKNEETKSFNEITAIDKKVVSMDVGEGHTVFVLESGEVYSCGYNSYGQLMLGPAADFEVFKPQKVQTFFGNATFVRCGQCNSFIMFNQPAFLHPGAKALSIQ